MRSRQLLAAAAGCIVVAAAFVVAAPGHAASARHVLPNTAPRWKAQATDLGPVDASAHVSARVYLTPRGGLAALARLATSLSTPGSANYAQFLTAAQYHERFAPTDGDVATVAAWLRSAGLTVTGTGAGNRYVSVSGSVVAARRAFGVDIDRFRRGSNTVQAPTGDVSVPDDVAGEVLAIDGLDTSPATAGPADDFSNGYRDAGPCSTYYGQIRAAYQADGVTPLPPFKGSTPPYAVCGYTGPQLRSAYEGTTALDGSGVTVAVTDAYASPSLEADANTYAVRNGDGAYRSGQLSQTVVGPFTAEEDCQQVNWYPEQMLDVEAVHAMAPGANVHYYAAASCTVDDLLDALDRVVDDGTAQLVTNSWSNPESAETTADVVAHETAFLQGAIEGMTFVFASGDSGDMRGNTGIGYRVWEVVGPGQVNYPSSDPYVTSVGGTATAIGRTSAIDFQTGWGSVEYIPSGDGTSWDRTPHRAGSGGGTSALFAQPSYQKGIVPAAGRAVPDVAMDADANTGFLVGETLTFDDGNHYSENRFGGTSLASPLFAGMTALAIQRAGHGAGLLNSTVYSHVGDFLDVRGAPPDKATVKVDYNNSIDGVDGYRYTLRTLNQDGVLRIAPGWDDVTGLGSPTSGWLTALP